MTFRDTIKQYFQTGDFPTEAQFYEFFDKIPFLDEVTASRITAIGQGQVAVPAGVWVDKIAFVDVVDIVVTCGRLAGSNDVIDNNPIPAGGAGVTVDENFLAAAGSLFFSGITPQTLIIIFAR